MSKPIKPNRLCTRSVEFRAVEAGAERTADGKTLSGYAAVFDTPTEINSFEGHFHERIAPGAFKKTISERTPVLQFDHGHDARTGSVPIGKIDELREDDHGLYVEARLFDNPVVEPIRQAIEGGAISGMSFRFKVNRDEWRDKGGELVRGEDLGRLLYEPGDRGPLQRTIREVQLFEAGPVVFPAYEATTVGVRSLTDEDREKLVEEYRRTMAEPDNGAENAVSEERLNKMPHGDVEYADPGYQADGVKRYPIDTPEHVHAALSYIAKGEDADKYTSEQLASVKSKIDAAAKEFGIQVTNDHDGDEKSASVEGAESREDITPAAEPEDAAPSGTSHREAAEKETKQRAAQPEPVTRKAERKMTKEELKAREAEIAERLAELGEETRDAELSDEVQGEWDGLVAERAQIATKVAGIEARQEVLRGLAASPKTTERSDRGTPAFHKKAEDIYDVEALRSDSYSTEDFSEKLQDNAMRAIEAARYGVRNKEEAQTHASGLFDSIDQPDMLAKRMLVTGSKAYESAFGKLLRHGNDSFCTQEERQALLRAQALGTDSAGGFAVPFQLDPTVILTNAGTTNPIRGLARVEQIVGKTWQGVTSAGVTVSRGAEGAVVGDNSFTLAQPTLSTNRVQGFVPFNIEIDLAWGALRSEITRVLVDSKNIEEESFIVGDGTGVNPSGVLTGATSTVTAGGTASFSAADVYALHAALPPRFEGNAAFLAHKAIYNKVRQFDTSGGSQLWAHIGDGRPTGLMGYRAAATSAMASTLTSANKIMVLGDFSQFLIVDRIGMNVELVPHLFDQATARPTGQRGVYAVWMNNSKVLVPGAFRVLVTG